MPEDFRRYADDYRETVQKNIPGGADDAEAMGPLLTEGIPTGALPDPDDAKPIANGAPLSCAYGVGNGFVKVNAASGVSTSAPDSVAESDTNFIPFSKCGHPSNPDEKCQAKLLADRWINTSAKNLLNDREIVTMKPVLVCAYGCFIVPAEDAQYTQAYQKAHPSGDKKAVIFEDERSEQTIRNEENPDAR